MIKIHLPLKKEPILSEAEEGTKGVVIDHGFMYLFNP
jgi:hypothetical protein